MKCGRFATCVKVANLPQILFGDQNEMVRKLEMYGVTPIFDVADLPH